MCNLSGPATSTRATEMRDTGPVFKERKNIVENVGRDEKKMPEVLVGNWKVQVGTGW